MAQRKKLKPPPEQPDNFERVEALVARVQSKLAEREVPKERQAVLADLLNCLSDLPYMAWPELQIARVELALSQIETAGASVELAEITAKDMLAARSGWYRKALLVAKKVYMRPPPYVFVVVGMLLSLGILPLFVLLIEPRLELTYATNYVDLRQMAYVGAVGSLGSVASVMVRLRDFSGRRSSDRSLFLFEGLFKPVIGMMFAHFMYVAIMGGIVSSALLSRGASEEIYPLLALTFGVGFSERIARDLTSRVDSVVSPSIATSEHDGEGVASPGREGQAGAGA